jgi:predicted O-methyltransferase YrrM
MNFIDSKILNYSISKSSTPSIECQNLEKNTKDTQPLHRMLCGPLEASLLKSLITLNSSKKVLELGTYTGYSSLCMAESLPEDGKVVTIDKNKKINEVAKEYWSKSSHSNKIEALFGDGLKVLETIDEKFDLIFIDADKRNYINYFNRCIELLSDKGIIVVDNVLWSGRVVEGYSDEIDKSTDYLKEFNDYISNEEGLVKTLLPIRDGIFLIQKEKK